MEWLYLLNRVATKSEVASNDTMNFSKIILSYLLGIPYMLETTSQVIFSIIQIEIGLIFFILIFSFIFRLSKKDKGVIVLPFDIQSNKKIYNGKAISDSLIAELRQIDLIHRSAESTQTELIHQSGYADIVPEKFSLPRVSPNTENLETKLYNVGDLGIAEMKIPLGGLILILKQLWPWGDRGKCITGFLQEHESEIRLIAWMEGHNDYVWNPSCEIIQARSKNNQVKDLAFMIAYDLAKDDLSKKLQAKTWVAFKYFTEALASYSQYEKYKQVDDLEIAKEKCFRAENFEKGYLLLINLYYNLGIAYINNKNYSSAEEVLRRSIALKPDNKTTFLALGVSLSLYDRQDEALKAYNKAIELDSKYALAWNNKGTSLSKLEKYEEAMEAYNKAIELDLQYALVWNNKGILLSKQEKYDEAIEAYNRAIELNPEDVSVWNNKGTSLSKIEKYDEALKAYDKAIELNPENADALYNKGLTLSELEKYDEALKTYEKAIEFDPKYVLTWYNKGAALFALEKYEEALKAYDKVTELDPENADALYNKGLTLSEQKKYKEAIEAYDKVIGLDPEKSNAWFKRASVYSLMENKEKALSNLKRAIELDASIKVFVKKHMSFEKLWDDGDFKKLVE